MSLDNPAGRLHALLHEAGVPSSEAHKDKVRSKWAKVFGVEPDDSPTLLVRLSEVMALPSKVREAVEAVPDVNHQMFLKHLPKVEKSFGKLNLDAAWHSFAQDIDGEAMYGLEMCDELLSRERPEPHLPDEERDRIQGEVRDLFEDVRAHEEDDDLREFLLRHLKAMDDALQEYKISGTPPVDNAIWPRWGTV